MRIIAPAAAAVLALAAGLATAQAAPSPNNYCKAFTQAECTADKGCAWKAAHAAGDINPKNGKAFKRAGKERCGFSPKDAQAILAKQFGKK